MYKIVCLSDPTGSWAEGDFPEDRPLDESELAFCFDVPEARTSETVERGGGIAIIIDELTGATLAITKED